MTICDQHVVDNVIIDINNVELDIVISNVVSVINNVMNYVVYEILN